MVDGYKVLGLCTDADADVDAVVLFMVCGQWTVVLGSWILLMVSCR